eukprot:GHVU01218679.1.p1 GENE.GHVU01218679.1~~GHVU01218679.1.p1  ORF type:complete len:140 (-),score=9.28 GHVU01218679.1:179-598(-)
MQSTRDAGGQADMQHVGRQTGTCGTNRSTLLGLSLTCLSVVLLSSTRNGLRNLKWSFSSSSSFSVFSSAASCSSALSGQHIHSYPHVCIYLHPQTDISIPGSQAASRSSPHITLHPSIHPSILQNRRTWANRGRVQLRT